MIDRAYMKEKAKASMRGRKPSIFLVTLVFLIINAVLNVLSVRVDLGVGMVEYFEMLINGEVPYVESSFAGSLISFAITLMLSVIGAGYSYYSLRVSRGEEAGFGELFDGFGIFFKVVFLEIVMGIFIGLWSLLFVIPGIIAAYRYSFALYILLDDPDKGIMECISESKEMTYGYKGQLFVLDLSFIGWNLLTAIPFVSLYVTPYTNVTRANYYNELSGWRPEAQPVYEAEYKEPWEQ